MKHLLIFLICCASVFGALRTFTDTGDGLWSTAGNWDTPPTSTDTVIIADGSTCDIDATALTAGALTVVSVTNAASGTVTVDSAVVTTLNMNLIAVDADLMTISGAGNVIIVGDITGGDGSGDDGIVTADTCTLTITGDITGGGTATAARGLRHASTGNIQITGNLVGDKSDAIINLGAAVITVTGNITGGTTYGYTNNGNGSELVLSGNATGGTSAASAAVNNNSSGSITTINGTAVISTTTAFPIAGLGEWNIKQFSYPSIMSFPSFTNGALYQPLYGD